MDSNIRDESRNRRREEALARRLGEALDHAAPRGTEPCPDAELIAAYHEHELGPEEAAQSEAHFAACSRCRKILAVLAASVDTPLAEKEVARLGELVAAARAPREVAAQTVKPVRPKLLDWRVRWLAPALGVAAVLAVWFAIRPPWRTAEQSTSGTLIAQAPKNEPLPPGEALPADRVSNGAPAKEADSATPPVILKDQTANKTESAAPGAEALAKNSLDDRRARDGIAPRAKVAENAPVDEMKKQPAVSNSMAAAPPPAPTPPPAPMRGPVAQPQANAAGSGGGASGGLFAGAAPPAPQMPASTTQSVTVTGEAPLVNSTSQSVTVTGQAAPVNTTNSSLGGLVNEQKIAELPLNGRNYTDLAVSKAAGQNTVLVKGLSGMNLWRAGKGGKIERSTDSGKTWRGQTSPLHDDWLAGAAVSDTVCWLAGRNGAIVQTTNGKRWKRIISPMQAATSGKLPDWVDVTASSAQTATITASDQRRFTTQDGGRTWQAQ